ncbi:MAG TPA: phospholipase D-like domain-containing protein, partial [Pararhizobium sp.]|nr:phospholipase D-like domain-containing protein [Pararhizobium sp.]
KIVVVDDVLAFCGGLDMTANRWDTRNHLDTDRRRFGHEDLPWHDSTTAVDGAVAKAIGELARERWLRATGEALAVPEPLPPIWPDRLEPSLTDVDVAIARTIPPYSDQDEIREVEHLYVDSIVRARRTIYCETQYFASDRIAEALMRRLEEPDGPEIVVLNPDRAEGLIGSEVMDTNRSRLLHKLAEHDRYGRFRILRPVTRKGRPIYVHSKILVVDDRLLRVGSSNLNNRSMGYDTECDIAVEADEADPARRQTITDIRNDLLAEHFGTTKELIAEAIERAGGSLIAALEVLMAARSGLPEKTLKPIVVAENGVFDGMVAELWVLDPDRPPVSWHRLRRFFRRLMRMLHLAG